MIRITGGVNRSRKLITPETSLTKPTMDKVRAAVFNALNEDVNNKVILDLFAGSGSYGLEAMSRGAKEVTFVDQSPLAISSINANIKNLKITNSDVKKEDALNYLNNVDKKFDIIFIDPPYKLEIYENCLELIENRALLNNQGIIVLETEKPLDINEDNYKKIKLYKYGLAKIYILRK